MASGLLRANENKIVLDNKNFLAQASEIENKFSKSKLSSQSIIPGPIFARSFFWVWACRGSHGGEKIDRALIFRGIIGGSRQRMDLHFNFPRRLISIFSAFVSRKSSTESLWRPHDSCACEKLIIFLPFCLFFPSQMAGVTTDKKPPRLVYRKHDNTTVGASFGRTARCSS